MNPDQHKEEIADEALIEPAPHSALEPAENEPLPEIDYSPPRPNQKFNRVAFFLLGLLTLWVMAGIASGGIYLMGRVLQHIIGS